MDKIKLCFESLSNDALKDFIEVCEPIMNSLCSHSCDVTDNYYYDLCRLQNVAFKILNSRINVTLIEFDKYETDN